jgi:hypothetical protein
MAAFGAANTPPVVRSAWHAAAVLAAVTVVVGTVL